MVTTQNITTYTIYIYIMGGLSETGAYLIFHSKGGLIKEGGLFHFFTQKGGLLNFSLIRGAY